MGVEASVHEDCHEVAVACVDVAAPQLPALHLCHHRVCGQSVGPSHPLSLHAIAAWHLEPTRIPHHAASRLALTWRLEWLRASAGISTWKHVPPLSREPSLCQVANVSLRPIGLWKAY